MLVRKIFLLGGCICVNMCVTHTRVFGMCAFCVRAAHESQAVCQLSPYSLSTYRFETGSLTEQGLVFRALVGQ